ncbi:CinA family protein [Sphingorhabdus sp.]|uniref:CinA family protein n=1 Tax=Sphingorhabdus sp. TaxID=1902408 RepID=UPI00398308D1
MDSVLPTDIAELAARVVSENKAAGRMVAIAESCTGGLVAAAITEVPGSSAVLGYGFVTYSNEAKMQMLGVNEDIIDTFGAVSVAVAWAMAQGALKRSGADVAVAISGVAGPDGGSANKPVGTVVFAVAMKGQNPEDVVGDRKAFGQDKSRADIRAFATLHALELLLPPTP